MKNSKHQVKEKKNNNNNSSDGNAIAYNIIKIGTTYCAKVF